MDTIQDARALEWETTYELNSPFAEAAPQRAEGPVRDVGYASWNVSRSPFAEAPSGTVAESEADRVLAEAFAELRDEAFDEAVAYLAEETEQAVADRFTNESPATAAERERYADSHLSAVRFEAQQYLDALEAGLTGVDVESLTDEQLDEALDNLDPQMGELSPAGEEFIGGLVRKAKGAVKFVVKAARNAAGTIGKVAGTVIGPILNKLKGLINPLLKRVLTFAIGRLPAPLQPVARTLSARILSGAGENEALDEGEAPMSPANLTDVEALVESFDAALAEAMTGDAREAEDESFEGVDSEADAGGRQLEMLAEARGVLIDRFRTANDEENLGPAVEQFVPALLGALRLGINLVGRPKVVGFLAGYLGKLISRWVGPSQSAPLSNAIVDTGLRLVTLESESGMPGDSRTEEAGPIALASVVEDTVRRLAENEDYVFENEDLMQLAASEAFSQAVATHFPPRFVRSGLQQAPSLGGTFIARRPRSIRTYRKYSRVPDVEITAQIADALPTFGGSTLGAALRAAGATFPLRARMHIYQSAVGTTLPRMIRVDRGSGVGGGGPFASTSLHPLTTAAAGLLLREPGLGAEVPATYLRSRNRIAVGQRFYALQPSGAAAPPALSAGPSSRYTASRLAPSRAWTVVNLRRSWITVGLYLSEVETQSIVNVIRQGRGPAALLQALTAAYRTMDQTASSPQGNVRIVREDHEGLANFSAPTGSLPPPGFTAILSRRLRAWVLPALANWVRNNSEAFVRAAAHPDAGVTIRVRLTGITGLELLGQAVSGSRSGAIPAGALGALRAKPTIQISVAPGRARR